MRHVTWRVLPAAKNCDISSRYNGRKFDIRHWVLLLHDGSMWALSDGSCRTASVPYIDGCWSNAFVHLTNHSVQVLSPPSSVAFV